MKAKLGLVILLVAVLVLVAGGGEAAAGAGGGKATGGGWFIDYPGRQKITFGFEAQYAGDDAFWRDAEGELQLVDHGTKTRIHGTFSEAHRISEVYVEFLGSCSINGTPGDNFTLEVWDYGEPGNTDGFLFYIGVWPDWIYHYSGRLRGGNIQIHEGK